MEADNVSPNSSTKERDQPTKHTMKGDFLVTQSTAMRYGVCLTSEIKIKKIAPYVEGLAVSRDTPDKMSKKRVWTKKVT